MDFKEIQDLIKMANKYNIADLKIEKKEFKIQIRTVHGAGPKSIINSGPAIMETPTVVQASAPAQVAAPAAASTAAAPAEDASGENSNHVTMKSPIIGTFYRSSGPDKDPFVKVGDQVEEGDVLCIIEAMKLFNEIESEFSGKIVKVLIDDASPIEYDQPLFIIDPS